MPIKVVKRLLVIKAKSIRKLRHTRNEVFKPVFCLSKCHFSLVADIIPYFLRRLLCCIANCQSAIAGGAADFPRLSSLTVYWLIPFISVSRFPWPNENTALRVDGLKPLLQLNHAFDLFRKGQIGKVAAALRLGILRFRQRSHRRHLAPPMSGQASPCSAHISAKRFLSNRSEARND